MDLKHEFKLIMKDTIAPLFKEHGFKKRGSNFAKYLPDFAWTVSVQSYRGNTVEVVEFTINTGIYTEKLFGTFYNFKAPVFPSEGNAVIRMSVNELKKKER